jgi:hypothetical protein
MTVSTVGGRDVKLRLMTADEFIQVNKESREKLIAQGGHPPEPVTRYMAENIVAPMSAELWKRIASLGLQQ